MQVIDADAHVIETERTWSYMEGDDRRFRPVLSLPTDETGREMWMIDGQPRGFRFPTLSEQELRRRSERSGRDVVTALAAREMDDVELRIRDMDRLGIDIQVLHNTICIEQLTDRPDADVALCRSWNRWLADIWKQGKGRLRWSMLPPVLSMRDALEEMRFARQNGAVAVCLRPVEGDRLLTDEYFHPIYDEAQRLDMAIAVHIANGNPAMTALYQSNRSPGGGFSSFRAPTVMACQQVLMSELPQIFPRLRWGFIEASANWVPWVVSDVRERYEVAGRPVPDHPLEAYRVYVTCQTNDDLPFVLKHAGEHSIVIGTDYGHFDPSSELDAITVLKEKSQLPAATIEKIIDANPRALYGL
ncbi:MAG TPA: amidohydrolase family protein [Chloroflexota bacterium]|nr:amidohydrolase family protein [Chloroflexota bacterium]